LSSIVWPYPPIPGRNGTYSTAELETIQAVITLVVFAGFSYAHLKEPLTWNHLVGFVLMATGAFFVFHGRS
jgi:uncharacterized protein (DUF486 family)